MESQCIAGTHCLGKNRKSLSFIHYWETNKTCCEVVVTFLLHSSGWLLVMMYVEFMIDIKGMNVPKSPWGL